MPEQDLASLTGVQKATSIGPPQPGTRIQPTPGEGPLTILARWLVGEPRPASVVAQDPFGITGWERGAGQPPLMFGTTDAGAPGLLDALAEKFPRLAKAIKAYHGSPHDFEQFDLSKIGTGEGAQAYGHGLYFAENEGVAQQYKRVLGNREFKIGDRSIVSPMGGSTRVLDQQSRAENIAAQALDDAINAQSSSPAQFASSRLRQQARYYPEEAKHIDEALDIIGKWQATGETHKLGGKMYEVAIHADPESFLDWDKPLSQQPKALKALRDLAPRLDPESRQLMKQDESKLTGPGLLTYAKRAFGSDEAASAYLKEVGIPGIKYLDQGSRAAGEGSRNYVVFDDKIVQIMKKYGVGLAAAQQIYRQQQEQGGK